MLKKIKRIFSGNKQMPAQIDLGCEEYVVLGTRKSTSTNLMSNEEISDSIVQSNDFEYNDKSTLVEKIYPMILISRVKSGVDLDSLKDKILNYDIVIFNFEDVPLEAIQKEVRDMINYMKTLNYDLGKIGEEVVLAHKKDIVLEKIKTTK